MGNRIHIEFQSSAIHFQLEFIAHLSLNNNAMLCMNCNNNKPLDNRTVHYYARAVIKSL